MPYDDKIEGAEAQSAFLRSVGTTDGRDIAKAIAAVGLLNSRAELISAGVRAQMDREYEERRRDREVPE